MHKFNLCHLLYLLQDSVWSLGLSILKHIIRHIRKSLPMFQLFQFFNASSKCGLNYMMHITDWTNIDIDIRHVGHCLTTFLDSFTLATNFLLEIETLFYSPPPPLFLFVYLFFTHNATQNMWSWFIFNAIYLMETAQGGGCGRQKFAELNVFLINMKSSHSVIFLHWILMVLFWTLMFEI